MREDRMNNKQKIALIAPLLLIGMMYPIFQFLTGALGKTVGWYLGLIIYWIAWGAGFSWLMIGKESIRRIIRPQKINIKVVLLVLFPLLMASLSKLIPGMEYEKPTVWIGLLLLSTTFGNGFFEELLWRGVYMVLFPDRILFRIIWPSILFALWHYAPGSTSGGGHTMTLMIGSGLFGFYLSFLAKRTGTIWWSILTHVTAGFIMIV